MPAGWVDVLLSSYYCVLVLFQVLSENNSHSRPSRLHPDHKLPAGIGKKSLHTHNWTDTFDNILNVHYRGTVLVVHVQIMFCRSISNLCCVWCWCGCSLLIYKPNDQLIWVWIWTECVIISVSFTLKHTVVRFLPHSWLIQCWLSYMLVMSFVCLEAYIHKRSWFAAYTFALLCNHTYL